MKFHFTPHYADDGITYVPLVDVVCTNATNGNSISVQCRIDSGADEIVLPAEVSVRVGLKLEEGELVEFHGIAHDPVDGYRHTVEMQIKNETRSYQVPCSFLYRLRSTGFLGVREFFENYTVIFDLNKKICEVRSE